MCNKSYGTLDYLRKYIDKGKSLQKTKEEEFINDIHKAQIVIIADDPGIGKTTSLTKLCALQYKTGSEVTSMFQSHWVISVNLKDHISTIGRIESSKISPKDIINLCLESDSDLNSPFTKQLLNFALNNTGFKKPLLIKFDGFDEVLDESIREKIISLLQYLKSINVKFWITTRLHYKNILENALSTFAIKIEPLDDEKKKNLFISFS